MFENTTNMHFATTLLLSPGWPVAFLPVQTFPYLYSFSIRPKSFASTSLRQHPNSTYNTILPKAFFLISPTESFRTFYCSMARDETKANIFHHIYLDRPIGFLPQRHIVTMHYFLFPFCQN